MDPAVGLQPGDIPAEYSHQIFAAVRVWWTHLVFTGNSTPSLGQDRLLLVSPELRVDHLVLVQLVHCLTERDGVRTPGVPGRSTPHHPRLAGLDALQEVVVLLLLAGLLRPVEEAVLGESDLVVAAVARQHVPACLVLQPDPRKDAVLEENVVEFGIVDDNSVVQLRVQVEHSLVEAPFLVRSHFLVAGEGVAHPSEYGGHVAPPQRLGQRVVPDGGVQGDRVVSHTVTDISTSI